MKIERNQLLSEIQTVSAGLADKPTIEQSNCFVFQKGEVLTYNDQVACRMKTCLDFTGAVNAKKMLEMLSKSNDDIIEFSSRKGRLLFKGNHKRGYFKADDKILLPIADLETPKKWSDLPSEFIDAVNVVQECACSNRAIVHLNSVHFTPDWLEACDGQQAGRYTIKIPFPEPTLINKKNIRQIIKLMVTAVGFTKNWVHFKNEAGLVVSCHKYMEDYPSERLTKIFGIKGAKAVLPKELKALTERVKVFLDDSQTAQWLKVVVTPEYLQVTGEGQYGKQTERQKIKYKGKELAFSINPELLRILTDKHDRCEISERVIKIKKDAFEYVTSLWIPNAEEKKQD
jgi:hypothetical protein